jgi:hypothetical protein
MTVMVKVTSADGGCETMKTTHQTILTACCLRLTSSVLAQHQTYLRGVVNVPGFQVALLEIHHTLKVTNAPPVTIRTSRLVRTSQQFEDDTIKGAHFQFEVLEIDWARETVKTREAGEEHTYSLPAPDRPASAKSWLHLHNATFNDAIDLYSELENRVLLLHPATDRAPLSLDAVWTNQVAEKAQAANAFVNCLNQRGISVVVDGAKFLRLLPSALNPAASPRSKDLPAAPAELGRMTLMNTKAVELAEMYATVSGRRWTGSQSLPGSVPYLNISQSLLRPEVLYVLETLLAWNDARILLGDDNTFSIARPAR